MEQLGKNKVLRSKLGKALASLERDPHYPGLRIERITNDPSAWSARIDSRYRLSFDISTYQANGAPDWSAPILLLRVLDHDDLYRMPH
ncbi:MAG: hypothetical protein A2Z99_15670 [Treponema sp. GWB1_62_6]|nr:MAG: hypothetical protein A2Y36_14060 [Treponema sp. GWA1_62_8]OHE65945.1 MAG: hypothetical protein A2001_15960 [Treponema sp. GWC1_61_84]OHE68837.1 MAG: hypothetical protein A2Z99_15670 [Treponema sp. GWB1_62_6]OHE73659.1 MAG: hypothetical protein A2413_10480 [Treponema sp. RIFOXYC1_FULL_61_9]HCM28214.1 hypothetical protein [Treponema sp.]